MDLLVSRYDNTLTATLSRVFVNGERFCDGLEPPWRANARRVSCIPTGRYPLRLRDWGSWHDAALKKFGEPFHKGMIEICDVPHRSDILIHWGNYPDDTLGCLLVGQAALERRAVWSSVSTYKWIYPLLSAAILSGELTHINFEVSA